MTADHGAKSRDIIYGLATANAPTGGAPTSGRIDTDDLVLTAGIGLAAKPLSARNPSRTVGHNSKSRDIIYGPAGADAPTGDADVIRRTGRHEVVEVVALSVEQFCERYGISRATAYVEMKEGRLKYHKVGRRRLIAVTDAEEWFANCLVTPKQSEAA